MCNRIMRPGISIDQMNGEIARKRESKIEGTVAIRTAAAGEKIAFSLAFRDTSLERGRRRARTEVREVDP